MTPAGRPVLCSTPRDVGLMSVIYRRGSTVLITMSSSRAIGRLRRNRLSSRTIAFANAYQARLADAIRASYPRLAEIAGDEFPAIVAGYLQRFPSSRLSTGSAGLQLAEYLADSVHPSWYAELAQLERAYLDVSDAPIEIPMRKERLATLDPEQPITLIPAHAMIAVTTSIDEVLRAIAGHDPLPRPRALDWPRVILVWRSRGSVLHRVVDLDEVGPLRAAAGGAVLAQLCTMFPRAQNPCARAVDLVLRWIDEGVVAGG